MTLRLASCDIACVVYNTYLTPVTAQDLSDNAPANPGTAQKAASKATPQAVDTIGESDVSDEEDWPTNNGEASKPPTATAAAAAAFAPSSLATLGQPAFQDEDDYDADEDAAPVAASQALPATQPIAMPASASACVPGLTRSLLPNSTAAAVASGAAAAQLPLPATQPQPSSQAAGLVAVQSVRSKAASLQQQVLLAHSPASTAQVTCFQQCACSMLNCIT